jgi:hypothetical protein
MSHKTLIAGRPGTKLRYISSNRSNFSEIRTVRPVGTLNSVELSGSHDEVKPIAFYYFIADDDSDFARMKEVVSSINRDFTVFLRLSTSIEYRENRRPVITDIPPNWRSAFDTTKLLFCERNYLNGGSEDLQVFDVSEE